MSEYGLATLHIESALVSHPAVAEVAVFGNIDELTYAFITLNGNYSPSDELAQELKTYVAQEIGEMASPGIIHFTESMPKTPSGKIMRWLLPNLTEGIVSNQSG